MTDQQFADLERDTKTFVGRLRDMRPNLVPSGQAMGECDIALFALDEMLDWAAKEVEGFVRVRIADEDDDPDPTPISIERMPKFGFERD